MSFRPTVFVKRFAATSRKLATEQRKAAIAKMLGVLSRNGLRERKRIMRRYGQKCRELAQLVHISLNVKAVRFLDMLCTGALATTGKSDQYARLFRQNTEAAFGPPADVSPVYGALNWQSASGGAASFEPTLWLRLTRKVLETRATFTPRDSYNIVCPFLPDFDGNLARARLLHETYVWSGVLDLCLNRTLGEQDTTTPEYIEAQIWGPVRLNDVETVYVREDLRGELERAIRSLDIPSKKKTRVLNMLQTFVQGGTLS